PMGVKVETSDKEITAQELEIETGTMNKMEFLFGGKSNAFAYLLFILIYMPCIAVIATIIKEAGLKWAIFSIIYLTLLAWIIATLFYQISMFVSQPSVTAMWTVVCIAGLVGFIVGLNVFSNHYKVKFE
nr:ferrous iron transporter B [Candidatus Cloacimonadota bacterium]